MKKYIVNIEDVGTLSEAAALQDSKIFLEKDTQSSFYIAHLEDQVEIPSAVRALPMGHTIQDKALSDNEESTKKFLDLRLCIEVPCAINKQDVEKALCKEISKTLKSLIKDKK
jgi:hypothetical protein